MGALFTEPIFLIELAIVAVIVFLQFRSFYGNKKRMDDYMDVFSDSESWKVNKEDGERVTNISGGSHSPYFSDIKNTINKYIAGSADSVADYQILKEAVDRHCDSIEDQIESQTPVPLYLGLAGTMLGIILGLASLIWSGAITDLAGVQEGQQVETIQVQNTTKEAEFKKATDGIGSLLLGVAVAMLASFVGISLTTKAAWNYKKRKEDAEKKKNEFLSWMQSDLLFELPNDISGAMAQLVFDLENFNETFEENTRSLAETFTNVNESYRTQADIVKAVQEMDVQSMATANIRVLQQLERSTERLERFNEYLNAIQGYTTTIQRFNEQYQQEETQLGLLRKIYDFFNKELHEIDQRKDAISNAVSSVDEKLQDAFTSLETSEAEQIAHFREQLQEQATTFSNMLDEQRTAFKTAIQTISEKLEEEMNQRAAAFNEMLNSQKEAFQTTYNQISQSLNTELQRFPDTVAQLRTVSQIPSELRTLSAAITSAMQKMSEQARRNTSSNEKTREIQPVMPQSPSFKLPKNLKWLMIAFFSIITLCSILSAVFCGIAAFRQQTTPNENNLVEAVNDSDTIANDSINPNKAIDVSKMYDTVDQQPSFPGGSGALQSWLTQNIQYPANAKKWGVQGNVIVSFVVEPDGTISEPTIVKGVDLLNEEAIRLIKAMPKWIPGKLKGENVRVKGTLTIPFSLK